MRMGLIPKGKAERRVAGLRDYASPSEVRVYSAKTGELLRVEPPSPLKDKPKTHRRYGGY